MTIFINPFGHLVQKISVDLTNAMLAGIMNSFFV
jgi:predicted benzoate:H+ symporter BenE